MYTFYIFDIKNKKYKTSRKTKFETVAVKLQVS